MVLSIHTYGDKVLRELNKIVKLNRQKEIKELYTNMFDTLLAYGGYGLSAPQVGENLKLFVVDTSGSSDRFFALREVFINCEIISKSVETKVITETCLSFPNLSGDVKRHNWIVVSYYDMNFKNQTKRFEGFEAAVIQHEYQHTNGILFNSKFLFSYSKKIVKPLLKIKKKKVQTQYKIA